MNPYRIAASLFWNRLKWDSESKSWQSRKKLKRLHNSHYGEKAVIICNGPSLLHTDLSLLEGTYTFGLNKINLLFEQSKFRPSCIVAVNPFVIEQNKQFYSETDIPLFLDAESSKISGLVKREHPCFLHTSDYPSFSKDCSLSVFQGYTVTYVAMQLAFHMGFSDVALVGCDHDFNTNGTANTIETAKGQDKSHFHENYFADGEQWQLPDLYQSEMFYGLAERMYREAGRTLINSTSNGKLEILPKVDIQDFISDLYPLATKI